VYPQFWTAEGTAWDFLQSGTEILKPHKADFVLINDITNKFSNFVMGRAGIKYEDAVILN
jgi:hypothetical protein